jgi:single-strand selective monofunctional uracil DNA glycosylase
MDGGKSETENHFGQFKRKLYHEISSHSPCFRVVYISPMNLDQIALQLRDELRRLRFKQPVAYVYNPLEYAWDAHKEYLNRYGRGRREALLIGMNPGPWGMVQTGVPFGHVGMVRNWLGIHAEIGQPKHVHPARPVTGFSCHRSEISGSRLWGWARDHFHTPDKFFERFFVVNYCPLCFFEEDGKNRTPDKLPANERERLFAACDRALRATVDCLQPGYAIGIGRFAESRANSALAGLSVTTACATHPSGANPRASRDWGGQMNVLLRALGVLA